MRRGQRLRLLTFVLALVSMGALGVTPTLAARSGSAPTARTVSGQYIVTFRAGVATQAKAEQLSRRDGVSLRHVYGTALNGVSVKLSSSALSQLRADPDIVAVTEDYVVRASAETLPSGVKRTEAFRSASADMGSQSNPIAVDVAVIDTGIDVDHPDLNVVGGVSCVPGEASYDDRNGHGTHVAGTIGALDNGSGVIGVAPGARLYAVRVLNANGEGDFSDVICGINWVAQNADHIKIANMSLGGVAPEGSCADQSLHQAICEAVDAGVTFTVAAGNDGADAANYAPASFDEVITVSAIADTDGLPGGKGATTFFYGDDDTLASFSNYGADVDIAAPGVNITSTWMGGGTSTASGTSMASPHVAGAAALYLFGHAGATPASVKAALLASAWPQASAGGFTADVDASPEPLLNAGAVGGALLTPSCELATSSGAGAQNVPITCEHFFPGEYLKVRWDSPAGTQRAYFRVSTPGGAGSANVGIPDVPGGAHTLYVIGNSSGWQLELPFTVTATVKALTVSGKVGSSLALTLKGFAAGETVSLNWFEGANSVALKTVTMSVNGGANAYLTVPEASAGPHDVQAKGSASGASATASFTVVPSVALSMTSGKPGTSSTATLKGYSPGETVMLAWHDTASATTTLGTVTVNALGTGKLTFVAPDAAKGVHALDATGALGNQASASFTILHSLTMTSASGQVGAPVTLTLRGYGADEVVELRWYEGTSGASSVVGSVAVGADGHATLTVNIPTAANGLHKLEAVGTSSGASAYGYITVKPMLTLSPTAGPVGATVTATLTGYLPGQTVAIKWYPTTYTSTTVASVAIDASGNASVTFVVPAGATTGGHKIDGVSPTYVKASATFTVN